MMNLLASALLVMLTPPAQAASVEICEIWYAPAKNNFIATLRCTDKDLYTDLESQKYIFDDVEDRMGRIYAGETATPYIVRHLRNYGYQWKNSGHHFEKDLDSEFGVKTYEICRIWSANSNSPHIASMRCTDKTMHEQLNAAQQVFSADEDKYGRIYLAETAKPFVMQHLRSQGYRWVAAGRYFEKTVESEDVK